MRPWAPFIFILPSSTGAAQQVVRGEGVWCLPGPCWAPPGRSLGGRKWGHPLPQLLCPHTHPYREGTPSPCAPPAWRNTRASLVRAAEALPRAATLPHAGSLIPAICCSLAGSELESAPQVRQRLPQPQLCLEILMSVSFPRTQSWAPGGWSSGQESGALQLSQILAGNGQPQFPCWG